MSKDLWGHFQKRLTMIFDKCRKKSQATKQSQLTTSRFVYAL